MNPRFRKLALPRPRDWFIELSDVDYRRAVEEGEARFQYDTERGFTPKGVGYAAMRDDPVRWRKLQREWDIRGRVGEWAFARMLGLDPVPDGNGPVQGADVAGLYHVRSRGAHQKPILTIRRDEARKAQPYVLVAGERKRWRALGWRLGSEAATYGELDERSGSYLLPLAKTATCDHLPGLAPIDHAVVNMRSSPCRGDFCVEVEVPDDPTRHGRWLRCVLCGHWRRP